MAMASTPSSAPTRRMLSAPSPSRSINFRAASAMDTIVNGRRLEVRLAIVCVSYGGLAHFTYVRLELYTCKVPLQPGECTHASSFASDCAGAPLGLDPR